MEATERIRFGMRVMSLGYVDSEATNNYLGWYDYKTGKILTYNCGGRATNIFGSDQHIGGC